MRSVEHRAVLGRLYTGWGVVANGKFYPFHKKLAEEVAQELFLLNEFIYYPLSETVPVPEEV